MRFLVFSDLHLDRAVEDVGPDHPARPRVDPRACLDRILALAETHEVDAILSVGGLYEHRRLRPGTAGLLVERLGQAGRPVFLAPGAEDPHTPDSLYATTTWPANVHVFDTDLLVPVELADGFRLWGAAHLGRGDTIGFLDGFRITDDAVNLAMFHGSEVGALGNDAPVVAPFRAEQVEHAGLTHAFVGGARAADAPWHTSPGAPHPPVDGEPDPQGVVIVDAAADGSLRRQWFGVAGPQVHEVTIDLADADSVDEVFERMITAVEDLQGTVHVHLLGQPAADVVVRDEDITSWSTKYLEIVLAPRPAPPTPPEIERPATPAPAPALRPATPSPEAVRGVTAAHGAWQATLASLRRHHGEEPASAERPDLGGLALDTLEAYLQTLRAHPAAPQPAPATEGSESDGPPALRRSRPRAFARATAALVTVSSAIGLLVIGETALERGVAVAALAVLVVIVALMRRAAAEEAALAASRAEVRTTLLLSTELSTASAQARHTATAALGRAGLPTGVDELAGLIERAHRTEAQQAARAAWEQRRADLATELEEATSRLRAALQRGGIGDTVDIEAAWACFQARAGRNPATQLPSPAAPTSEPRLVVGW